MSEALGKVLAISLPLFVVMGLGMVLRRRGMITDEVHNFLSRFVFVICLPVAIFKEIAAQDFTRDISWGLVVGALVPGLVTCAVFFLAGARLKKRLRAPFAVATSFGNTAFIGFPLIQSAYPGHSLGYAAVFNALYLPVFFLVSVLVLSVGHVEREKLGGYVRSAVLNPVVIAALVGLLASLAIHQAGPGLLQRVDPDGYEAAAATAEKHAEADEAPAGQTAPLGAYVAENVPAGGSAITVAARSMDMVGGVGLVLALLAVGAALHLDYIRGHVVLMSLASAGKLLVMPALAFVTCRYLFPGLQPQHAGTIVLLSACPLAVGIYVMSQQMETDSDFMAGTLVLSTVLAAVTIPFWLMLVPQPDAAPASVQPAAEQACVVVERK